MHDNLLAPPPSAPLRWCRALVWTQAMFLLFGGAFIVLTAVLFGDAGSIPFRGQSLSGGRALGLGLVYLAAGAALGYMGLELGRRAPWARPLIVCTEVFLGVLLIFRSFELSVSVVLNIGLTAAILVLLALPDTAAA